MILNTYLKSFDVKIALNHKKYLGINLVRSFRTRFPGQELKKVRIKEEEESFEVYDYPKEFLYSESTLNLVRRFLRRSSKNKKFVSKIELNKNVNNEPKKERVSDASATKNHSRVRLQVKH